MSLSCADPPFVNPPSIHYSSWLFVLAWELICCLNLPFETFAPVRQDSNHSVCCRFAVSIGHRYRRHFTLTWISFLRLNHHSKYLCYLLSYCHWFNPDLVSPPRCLCSIHFPTLSNLCQYHSTKTVSESSGSLHLLFRLLYFSQADSDSLICLSKTLQCIDSQGLLIWIVICVNPRR